MAPFGLKLGENAFQRIPDISFFDAELFFFDEKSRLKSSSGGRGKGGGRQQPGEWTTTACGSAPVFGLRWGGVGEGKL